MTQTHRGRSRARGGAGGRFPLSEAKLAAPSVRPGTMDRPRIRSVLDRDDVALTLVAAPPGYGKTTAVRVWCAGVDAALSWVTLDPVDNDPVSLWSYVATAVDRIREGLGRRALQRLNAGMSSSEDAVEELLNGMAAFGAPIVLVLDDLHTVTSPECLGSLDHAISHLPPNVRLFAISRTDPALDLARLRVSQALVELRAAELAFTPTEAHDLLVARGQLKIAKPQVDELVERTEGWPAALVLAGLWLRTRDDPDAVVRDFRGDHRLLAEYLSREVMASMDHDQRTFMLTAAVLGEVTPDLCDAVLGRTDSAAILSDLEHSNLFVQRLERGAWYRVHPLFAEYARAQLADAEPDAPARIDTHAARWLRERGLVIEALEHASAAGDHEMVAELVHEHHLAPDQERNGPDAPPLGAHAAGRGRRKTSGDRRLGSARRHRCRRERARVPTLSRDRRGSAPESSCGSVGAARGRGHGRADARAGSRCHAGAPRWPPSRRAGAERSRRGDEWGSGRVRTRPVLRGRPRRGGVRRGTGS